LTIGLRCSSIIVFRGDRTANGVSGALMRDRFEDVIEKATGREVIGFMSGNQQDPDMMCEVFVLSPTDLLS
jgi:hypothetical protein